jgi:2-amino-4-hydroxy-6-hydroxymethyldihydropteridine diphosphokinase
MQHAYLSIGSNSGNMAVTITNAINDVCANGTCCSLLLQSSLYKTQPWGITEQPYFLNCVICVATTLLPTQLLQLINAIEHKHGRLRTANNKWQERTLDIDIVLINNIIINTPNLTVPHAYMHQRNFVLVPLAQIAPSIIHPVFGLNIEDLKRSSKDVSWVELL